MRSNVYSKQYVETNGMLKGVVQLLGPYFWSQFILHCQADGVCAPQDAAGGRIEPRAGRVSKDCWKLHYF